jgi:methyl-accepting chemotaxis protein
VQQPLRLAPGSEPFGALIVATPKTEIASGLRPLVERLGLALIGGIVAAGLLGWYLSRRITRPVLALSAATDEITRGHYDVDLPPVRGGGEIGHLAQRFRENGRAAERGRAAGAQLPDDRVARAADAADCDPRPRRSAARRAR